VVLILGLTALIVASTSGAILWSAYRSHGRRVEPGRREDPRRPDQRNRPAGPNRGARDGGARGGPVEGPARGRGAETANCGPVRPWDADGDGISDSLERSNAPFHSFNPAACDRDPSTAIGSPASGTLKQGVNLTDEGSGYLHVRGSDPPDADDWATLSMLNCIEAVGREAETLNLRMTVTDLSLRTGGLFVPHSSHQNGLDADLRYVRADGRLAPLDIRQSPRDYDALTTQAVLQTFIRQCPVSTIFADLPSLAFTNDELDRPVLVQAPGHTNHFHIRLRPPS
jgi:hypothetical protein